MPLDWSLSAVTHRGSHGLLSCMAYHSSSPLSARRRERQQTGHVSEAAECFFSFSSLLQWGATQLCEGDRDATRASLEMAQ